MNNYLVLFSLCLFTVCQSTILNNPIKSGNYEASVLKVGNIYYMLTNNISAHSRVPIYKSTDLQNWELQTYVFNSENYPTWARNSSDGHDAIYHPKMYFINGSYVVYFSAFNSVSTVAVGVAKAGSPTGPFTDLGKPLLAEEGKKMDLPSFAQDGK